MKKNTNINIPLISSPTILIFLAFFFAKIFDKIDWSWWWVFSPLWIPIVFVFGILIFIGIIYLIYLLLSIWK